MRRQITIGADSLQSSSPAWAEILEPLRNVTHVTVLTGAGVSAESGLPTFRAGGLWESYRFEDVATPQAFERDPELVWRFYNYRRDLLTKAKPNPAHIAIRDLQRAQLDGFTLVTQNVDGLHQAAGSTNVLELHGSLRTVRCTGCNKVRETLQALPELPTCECGDLLRPGVVWFGESLPWNIFENAQKAVRRGGVLIVVGTSAVVHPAAGLVDLGRDAGAFVIEVNPTQTEASDQAHALLRGNAGTMMPELVARCIKRRPLQSDRPIVRPWQI